MDYTGTAGDDQLIGGVGDDLLQGLAGDDDLRGGDGADSLDGGDGEDVLRGQAGDDTLDGGAGNDVYYGGDGNDVFVGDGADRVSFYGATTGVTVDLSISGQQDTGWGLDTFTNIEEVSGTPYSDTLVGDAQANWLWGSGPGGDDSLAGGDGDDLLSVATGNHTLDGGAGVDTADVPIPQDLTGGVNVSLALQGAAQDTGQGSMTLISIENLSGSVYADTLTGDAGANLLAGNVGSDSLVGGDGDDVLRGDGQIGVQGYLGAGPIAVFTDVSSVDSPAGDDTLEGEGGADALYGAGGYDILRGGDGDDTLNGEADDDLLVGGAGNDVLDGGAGIDRVSFGGAANGVTVDLTQQGVAQDTGEGTDTLTGVEQVTGSDFDDHLTGDDNANWLWTLGGNDTVAAGAGDDLVSVGAGAHVLDGGAGVDTLAFYSITLTGPVNVSLAAQGAAQDTGQGSMTLSGFEGLSGTAIGGDTLSGDAGDNLLAGWGGGDSLAGGDGADLLLGDGYVDIDSPNGGAGPVTTFQQFSDGGIPGAAAGPDTLDGGAGDDTLVGSGGNDLLTGGDGSDTAVFTGAQADYQVTLQGNGDVTVVDLRAGGPDGSDTLSGVEFLQFSDGTAAQGSDQAGNSGNETLAGGAGPDTLDGAAGDDVLLGGPGDDLLQGGVGQDGLRGEGGDDTLNGQDGDDFLAGYAGNDVLDGGAGIDRAAFAAGATGGVTVDLNVQGAAQDTGQGLDVLIGIENVSGTAYSDMLTGDGAANWLWGGSDGSGVTGDDTISAGGGGDLVQVGAGDHSLDGGAGVDTLSFEGNGTDISAAGVSASLAGQGGAQNTGQGSMTFTGFENLSGSTYADTLDGDAGANLLAGYDGSDSLSGGDGADTLLGDSVVITDTQGAGTSGPITTFADEGAGDDTLDGGAGDDLIKGEAGADRLFSGAGDDTLDGGAGADVITAQAGSGEVTHVTLGADADTLALDAAMGGAVVVSDFATGAGGDALDMAGYLTAKLVGWNGTDNPYDAGFLRLMQDGSSTLLQIDENGGGDAFTTLVTLQNTSALLFDAGNLGYAPPAAAVGGGSGDAFAYEFGGAVSTLDGGAGTDTLTLTTPALAPGDSATVQPSGDGTALLFDLDGDGLTDLTVSNVEDIVLNGQRVVISGDLSGTGLAPNTIYYTGTAADDLLDASGLVSAESVRAQGLAGADTLIGADDDDTLEGGDGADSLSGRGGPDLLDGGAGDDTMVGGDGADVAVFSGLHTHYTVTDLGGGMIEVAGPDGTDRLSEIEQLQFDDGAYGQNQAPSGTDRTVSVVVNGTKTLSATDFGFTDPDGDGLGAVKIVTAPTGGGLRLSGVDVTDGQVVSAADIAAGHLRFSLAHTGSTTFTFQVQDDGLVGWGENLDASANTLTVNVTAAPPPPPPPVTSGGTTGTAGPDTAAFDDAGHTFFAGDGADTVHGGGGGDILQGNAGRDDVSGGGGGDALYGGRDDDQLSGDDGDDYLSGDLGADTLSGGDGDDRAFGGDGDDQIDDSAGENYLRGGAGDDVVSGGSGFDDAHGNQGNDTVSGGDGDDWVVGGKDNDTLSGDAGDDIVYGNLGDDTCNGGDGADVVRGGQNNDVLNGGAGDDWLSGDLGDDTVTGGAGADIFHTFTGAGIDRVLDFHVSEGDRVMLDPGTQYAVAQVGADTVIDIVGGGQMVLVGVQLTSLPSDWLFGA